MMKARKTKRRQRWVVGIGEVYLGGTVGPMIVLVSNKNNAKLFLEEAEAVDLAKKASIFLGGPKIVKAKKVFVDIEEKTIAISCHYCDKGIAHSHGDVKTDWN